MLSDTDVDALVQACHADPFGVLGLHPDAEDALWMRALLPGAAEVTLHEVDRPDAATRCARAAAVACGRSLFRTWAPATITSSS